MESIVGDTVGYGPVLRAALWGIGRDVQVGEGVFTTYTRRYVARGPMWTFPQRPGPADVRQLNEVQWYSHDVPSGPPTAKTEAGRRCIVSDKVKDLLDPGPHLPKASYQKPPNFR